MSRIYKNKYYQFNKNDLLTRIRNYEANFISNNKNELNEERNEILEQVYKGSKNIGNKIFDNFLSEITENLNNYSEQNSYQYIYFFKDYPNKHNSHTYLNELNIKEKYAKEIMEEKEKNNTNINQIYYSSNNKNNTIKQNKKNNNNNKKKFEDKNNFKTNDDELKLYIINSSFEEKEANEQLENIQTYFEDDNINNEEKNNIKLKVFDGDEFILENSNNFNDKEPNFNIVSKNERTEKEKSKINYKKKSKYTTNDIIKEANNYFQKKRKRFHKNYKF